jgi:peroxiredoxin
MSHFDDIGDIAKKSVGMRSLRRAAAVNAVVMAREHAQRALEPFTQSDADVIMAIMELLEKVAGA